MFPTIETVKLSTSTSPCISNVFCVLVSVLALGHFSVLLDPQLSCMYGWMVGVCYHRRIKCQARMSGRGFAVGSNELTAPLIEEDFKAALTVLEAHLAAPRAFLFGGAPCFADFGLAAQIHQARIDPTVRLRHAYYMHVRAFARACVWSCVCVCAYVVRMAGRLCVCVYVYALSQL